MDPIKAIENWYEAQCDDDWEHTYGVTIETLDNPGWMIKIDLIDTPLEQATFESLKTQRTERDWLECHVENKVFKGYGGSSNLNEVLEIFAAWAMQQR